MIKTVTSRNCIYQTAYHVVWCPKYRKAVLTGEIPSTLESMLREICTGHGWEMISLEMQPDQIHLFLSIPPADAVATAVKLLKGITARKLFLAFPGLKKSMGNDRLWSPSYYVGTAGNVSVETIHRYIERTEHIKGRR